MPVPRYLLWLFVRDASLSTGISLVVGLWLAWTLSNREFAGKRALGALDTAALVLLSPLLCYYLPAVFCRIWPLTEFNLVAVGVVSAMPLVIRASRTAFTSLDPNRAQAARLMGSLASDAALLHH